MEILEGLRVQKNVIYALMQREAITRYSGSSLGYIWAAAEPVFHITAYLFFFELIGKKSPIPSEHTITVLALALVPFLMFRRTTLNMMFGIESNLALLSYPHVKPIDILLSRLLLESSVMGIMYIFAIIMFKTLGWYTGAASYVEGFLVYLVLLCFSFGVGLINASIVLFLPSYKEIYSNLMRIVYWTSGIFYLVSELPKQAQEIFFYFPSVHFSEWFRSALIDGYNSEFYDKAFIITLTLVLLVIGLTLIISLEDKIRELHD